MPNEFERILAEAVEELMETGFDSMERVEAWTRKLREAARRMLISPEKLDELLRERLASIYRRMVERDGILRYNPGVERFTYQRIKPKLRAELDRRIMASANLIRLNRDEAIEKTLKRFQGWSTSLPKGGVSRETRAEVKANVRKSVRALPFEERRVLVDQGHKLVAAINDVIAVDGGAIAGRWRSNFRQPGYDYREDHRERDDKVYLIRNSWAQRAGLVKPGRPGYSDDVTQPGQEVFCFPGDSRIPFADSVGKAYRRFYSGELTSIITASKKTVRATPNHPILTVNGWVAIGALNEGDYVIEATEQSFDVRKNHENDAVPLISEIFSAIQKSGGLQSTRKGQLDQFHGDGSNSDVDIIDAAGVLTFGPRPTGSMELKRSEQFRLAVPATPGTGFSAFNLFLKRLLDASSRLMSRFHQSAPPSLAFAGHADQVGFGSVPQGYSEPRCQRTARDVQSFGQAKETFPFEVRATRVIKVERRQWTGHVYNLQTESGWYVADGIIAHNCRCYYIYLYALSDLPADMLTAKGKAALSSAQGKAEVYAARTGRADAAMTQLDDEHHGHVVPIFGPEGQRLRARCGGLRICYVCQEELRRLRRDTADKSEARGPKATKAETEYVDAGAPRPRGLQCNLCSMFRAPRFCAAVLGDVSPAGYCSFFEFNERMAKKEQTVSIKAVYAIALRMDRLGYLKGARQIERTLNVDQWNAAYDDKRDEISLERKFDRYDPVDQVRTILHEAGHRGQLLKDVTAFDEFKRRRLDTTENFLAMANPTHVRDYEASGRVEDMAGEVFAESYSRACLGLPMPVEIRAFWEPRLETARAAA
jgi:hypothetical protein